MTDFLSRLQAEQLVVIVRAAARADAERVGKVLLEEGVRLIEVTLTTDDAVGAIETLRSEAPADALVGAGTVVTLEDVDAVLAAGAQFVVTPAVTDAVRVAADRGLPVLAGAYTPTEAVTAIAQGAAAVKLFPASAGGPAYVKALRDPFPRIPFVPVGGVTPELVAPYLTAGAVAVGIGGPITGDAVRGGSLDALRDRVRAVQAAIEAAS